MACLSTPAAVLKSFFLVAHPLDFGAVASLNNWKESRLIFTIDFEYIQRHQIVDVFIYNSNFSNYEPLPFHYILKWYSQTKVRHWWDRRFGELGWWLRWWLQLQHCWIWRWGRGRGHGQRNLLLWRCIH